MSEAAKLTEWNDGCQGLGVGENSELYAVGVGSSHARRASSRVPLYGLVLLIDNMVHLTFVNRVDLTLCVFYNN